MHNHTIHILRANLHLLKKPMSQTLSNQINQIQIFSKILPKRNKRTLQMILILQLIRMIRMKKQRKNEEQQKKQNCKLWRKQILLPRIQLAKLLQFSKFNHLKFNRPKLLNRIIKYNPNNKFRQRLLIHYLISFQVSPHNLRLSNLNLSSKLSSNQRLDLFNNSLKSKLNNLLCFLD